MAYSKVAHEHQRKLDRQHQRAVVIDWSLVARNALDQFVLERLLCIYSTEGRRLRVWSGRGYRKLTNGEFASLWNIVRAEIVNQDAMLSVRRIEFGVRAVALLAPPTKPIGKVAT